MTWVLWDILVPLLLSFGLGTFLSWQIWRGRHFFAGANEEVTAVNDQANVSEVVTEKVGAIGLDSGNSVALSELEAANITLIGERDRATEFFEESRDEIKVLKARIEELEAQTLEYEISASDLDASNAGANSASDSASDSASPESAARNVGILAQPLDLSDLAAVDKTAVDKDELLKVKAALDSLKVSYESELKEKRELELTLLNTKNQCEKLEVKINEQALAEQEGEAVAVIENEWQQKHDEIQKHAEILQADLDKSYSTITELKTAADSTEQQDNLSNQIAKKDLEIENLNATVTRLEEESEEVAESAISVEIHQQEIKRRDHQIEELKLRFENSSAVDSNVLADKTNKQSAELHSAVPPEGNLATNESLNYVPTGWSIPSVEPSKSERDKLTAIKGVGPVLEKMLHQSGIYFFRQVALLDSSGVDELQQQIPQFPGRIKRDDWVNQAKKFHLEKYGTVPVNSLSGADQ